MAGRKLPVLPTLADFPETGDILYVVDVSDTSESPQGTSKQMQRGTLLDVGAFTVTPDVTAGSGAVDDFNFDYFKIGGKVILTFLCRSYVITVGESTTTVQLDLTGTAAEPSANFSTGFNYKGSVNTGSYSSSGNVVQDIAINTVAGTKKLQVILSTEANVATIDFETLIGGTITITI